MNSGAFERWFDKLVKAKFGGPALAVAGICLGLLVIGASWAFPEGLNTIGIFGYILCSVCTLTLAGVVAIYNYVWLREIINGQRQSDTKNRVPAQKRPQARALIAAPENTIAATESQSDSVPVTSKRRQVSDG